MTTITTRAGKGSPLSNNEMDANLTGLNDDKVEASGDSMTGDLSFGDNNKVILGAGPDLRLYHDGSNSYINDTAGTGNLYIASNQLIINNAANSENMARFVENGAATLYYDGAAKIATTSSGIDVTGSISADGLTVDVTDQVIINHSGDGGGIRIDSTNGTNTGSLRFGDDLDNYIGAVEYNHSTNTLSLYADNATRVAVNSSGIDVTGTVTASHLTLSDSFPVLKIEDSDGTNQKLEIVSSSGASFLTARNGSSHGTINLRRTNGTTTSRTMQVTAAGDVALYADDGTTQAFYWDASTSRLGLGETNPAGALHIHGGSYGEQFISSSNSAMRFVSTGGVNYIQSGTATSSSSAADLIFTNVGGSGETMRITSSGLIGIGTGSPSTYDSRANNLVVGDSGDAGITIFSGASNDARLQFAPSGDTGLNNGLIGYDNANDKMSFATAGTDRMHINSSGIAVTGNVVSTGLTGSSIIQAVGADSNGFADVEIKSTGTTGASRLFFSDTAAQSGFIKYNHSGNSMEFGTGGAERFTIDSGGNAIFTKANGAYLQLKDASAVRGAINVETSDGLVFTTGASFSERMRIDGSGNVGIGTSSTLFDVLTVDDTNPKISMRDSGTERAFFEIDSSDNFVINNKSASAMILETSDTERMRIHSNGRVSIGSSPSSAAELLNLTATSGNGAGIEAAGNGNTLGSTSAFYGQGSGSDAYVWNRANSTILFGTNNTECARFGSSGDMEIGSNRVNQGAGRYLDIYNRGTDSVSFSILRLITEQVGSTSLSTSEFYKRKNGETTLWNHETSSDAYLRAGIGTTEAWRIHSSGNVLLGKSSPAFGTTGVELNNNGVAGKVHITRSGGEPLALNRLSSDGSIIEYYKDGSLIGSVGSTSGSMYIQGSDSASKSGLTFYGASIEPRDAGASADGAVDLGATGARFKDLHLSGDAFLERVNTDHDGDWGMEMSGVSTARIRFNSSAGGSTTVGSITVSTTATAYNQSSDERLKENIVDAPSASDDIDALQVRSFDWKVNGEHQKYGMIAQELNTVAPDAVTIPDDPEEMAGVDYSKLVPMLVKEIQSLRARVAQLEGAN